MSHIGTRSYINNVLRLIGANGLSGMVFPTGRISEVSAAMLSMLKAPEHISSHRLIAELRRQDLVLITKLDGSIKVQLSVKGVHRLQLAEIRSTAVASQKTWDHIWRMVVFDIPARHADSRYLLTSELKRLGFVMLQNSMWIHPYPCFEQISIMVQYANIQPFVTYAEISSIDMRSQQKLLVQYPELSN
ncbi:MAG: hypothetical protein ABIQ64_03410 [Candidatus Saccharimonadales bacterium]